MSHIRSFSSKVTFLNFPVLAGRIYIPKTVREKLSLKLGDRIYIRIEDESLIVFTMNAIRKRLGKVTQN